MFLDGVQF